MADGIAADIDELQRVALPEDQVEAERRRIEAVLAMTGDGPSPVAVKEQIRRVMWDKVGVEKNGAGLLDALEELDRIRSSVLPNMKLRNRTRVANYEWLDAIDVCNMIDAAELIVHSSIERRESRGPFMRTDFPETDNENWLAAKFPLSINSRRSIARTGYWH